MNNLFSRIAKWLRGGVYTLRAVDNKRGNVLLSYTTLPFFEDFNRVIKSHTNRYECFIMAKTLSNFGYDVDIIDFENQNFVPKKKYKYFIDVGTNIEKFKSVLNSDCIKIFHITTCYREFNNSAEEKRFRELGRRRSVYLKPDRLLPPSNSEKFADIFLLLGNDHTKSTYANFDKDFYKISISTIVRLPFVSRNIDSARKNIVWISGAGLVHKGLDLLLEAFSSMPDYNLHLVGKTNEPEFLHVYDKELKLKNIYNHGFVDLTSENFKQILNNSLFVISASCSEGQSGSVIVGMHGSLIPIVTKETGVDTNDFGITLNDDRIDTIIAAIKNINTYSNQDLYLMSKKSWEYANNNHTREKFEQEFKNFVIELEKKYA